MNNPHIIVDPATKRCLCGTYVQPAPDYHSRSVGCCDILRSLDQLLKHSNEGSEEWYDLTLVKQALATVTEDRP